MSEINFFCFESNIPEEKDGEWGAEVA